MKTALLIVTGIVLSLSAYAQVADPMGLSDYLIHERNPQNRGQYQERRLTNHEAWQLQQSGAIKSDGSLDEFSNMLRAVPKPRDAVKPQTVKTPPLAAKKPTPSDTKGSKKKHPLLKRKPKPSSKEIAKQTKTKHKDHPKSKGTVEVRPTTFPENPTRDQIVQMQQHIQHIERTVGKALDLSLSAYAVAELPQATEGRSGLSVGAASAGGRTAEALGFSSNFGDEHQYTIKISLSHAGHQNAVGAGASWQW